jgi:hypothetical protein
MLNCEPRGIRQVSPSQHVVLTGSQKRSRSAQPETKVVVGRRMIVRVLVPKIVLVNWVLVLIILLVVVHWKMRRGV